MVLNPNEASSCRLSPSEVALLLDKGAVAQPHPDVLSEDEARAFLSVEVPPSARVQSLPVLFSRNRSVHRAYVAYCFPPDQPDAKCYMVVIRVEDRETQRLVLETAQVMLDVPPNLGMDVITCFDDARDLLQLFEKFGPPFYDRAWGERLMVPERRCST